MNRRGFFENTLSIAVAAGCATKVAAQVTLDPASERYRRLQTALLKSRRLPCTECDVDIAPLGLRAHVLEAGAGDPLLLVHGGNGVGAHWLPLMTRLTGWRMIVPDRPGCGLTDGFLYDGVDMRAHGAAFVAGVLDALEVEAASIIGNSMGGYFALCFALAHPDRVRHLVLAGGPAGSARSGSGFPPPAAVEARVKSSRAGPVTPVWSWTRVGSPTTCWNCLTRAWRFQVARRVGAPSCETRSRIARRSRCTRNWRDCAQRRCSSGASKTGSIRRSPTRLRLRSTCRTRVSCCCPTRAICRGSTSRTNAPR